MRIAACFWRLLSCLYLLLLEVTIIFLVHPWLSVSNCQPNGCICHRLDVLSTLINPSNSCFPDITALQSHVLGRVAAWPEKASLTPP